MFFHVKLIHDVDNCPGYNKDMMPKMLEMWESRDQIAGRYNIKLHHSLNALPAHHEYWILEAEEPANIAMFMTDMLPYKIADIEVTPVQPTEQLVERIKKMMAG